MLTHVNSCWWLAVPYFCVYTCRSCPILLLQGDEDKIVPPNQVARLFLCVHGVGFGYLFVVGCVVLVAESVGVHVVVIPADVLWTPRSVCASLFCVCSAYIYCARTCVWCVRAPRTCAMCSRCVWHMHMCGIVRVIVSFNLLFTSPVFDSLLLFLPLLRPN